MGVWAAASVHPAILVQWRLLGLNSDSTFRHKIDPHARGTGLIGWWRRSLDRLDGGRHHPNNDASSDRRTMRFHPRTQTATIPNPTTHRPKAEPCSSLRKKKAARPPASSRPSSSHQPAPPPPPPQRSRRRALSRRPRRPWAPRPQRQGRLVLVVCGVGTGPTSWTPSSVRGFV